MDGQLPFHQGAEVAAGNLPEVQAPHVKGLFRSGANLLENIKDLGYIDFRMHGVSPFWFGLGTTQFNGDPLFFIP